MKDHKELMHKAAKVVSESMARIADATEIMKPEDANTKLAKVISDELRKMFFDGYAQWQKDAKEAPMFGWN